MNTNRILQIAVPFIFAGVVGCSGSGTTAATGPGVRVINALSSVTQASVTVGTVVVASPLIYATPSGTPAHPYAIVPSLPETLSLANLSTPTTSVASSALSLLVTQDITAIAYNPAAPQFLVLNDSLTIPTTSEVRLVNASTVAGSVDFILKPAAGVTVGPITLAPGTVSPTQLPGTGTYTSLATSGSYFLQVFPAGKDTGSPIFQETVQLPTGVSWSFYVLDPAPGQAVPIVLQVQDNLLHDIAP